MEKIKKLYDVIPEEKRVIQTVKMAEVVGKPLVIHEVSFTRAGEVDYAMITLTVGDQSTRAKLTANQLQIVEALRFVADKKAFPVSAMVIAYGKSYAITNPPDPVTPDPDPEKKAE